jgi:CRISPR-associated protein Cas2
MSRSSPTGEPQGGAGAGRAHRGKQGQPPPARSATRLAVLVIYDIPHDGTRTKVADVCLDYGLDRVQYSAFIGELSRTHQEELLMRVKRRVGKRAAKVQLVTVAADDWARRLIFEQGEPNPPAGASNAEDAAQTP